MTTLLGVEFAPLRIPLRRRLQTLAVLHYIAMFVFLPFLCVFLPIYTILFTQYWWTMLLYAAWVYYDFDTPKRGGRPCQFYRRFWLWRYFRDYFPITLVKTHDLDPKRNYIFGYHPHGIVSIGAFMNFATEATNFSSTFPGITPHLCTLVGQFWFPFRREYTMLFGAIEVSRSSIQWQLSRPDKGHAVVIVVGGAQEALDARPGCYEIVLSRRKGFVKMAIQYGVDLVPVFSFGENDLFLQFDNPEGGMLRKVQEHMKKIFGYSPPLFHGRGIFNYTYGIMPYRKPMYTVVGKPIQVEQCSDPTPEQVTALHEKYMQGLVDLFEDNKLKYGIPEDTHLKIH